MADETQNQPAAKPDAPPAKPKPITPTATRITQRPPDKFKQAIVDFAPDGNGHPVRLAAAKAALETLAADFPDADNIEARVETSGTPNGHQILVQVIKHKF
jgi:hypothetical protein